MHVATLINLNDKMNMTPLFWSIMWHLFWRTLTVFNFPYIRYRVSVFTLQVHAWVSVSRQAIDLHLNRNLPPTSCCSLYVFSEGSGAWSSSPESQVGGSDCISISKSPSEHILDSEQLGAAANFDDLVKFGDRRQKAIPNVYIYKTCIFNSDVSHFHVSSNHAVAR